jgi:hypothetical protein
MTSPDVKFTLPEKLADKVASFPESSYGAKTVTLLLRESCWPWLKNTFDVLVTIDKNIRYQQRLL